MRSALDHEELLVVGILVTVHHGLISILSKIEGMCLVAMHDHDSGADLVAVLQDRHIDERHAADLVPSAVRVEGARVIPSLGLVVGVIVLDKVGRVLGQRVNDAAAERIRTGLEILDTLGIQRLLHRIALFLAVIGVEISLCVHSCHIVHGRGDRRLDAGVQRRRVERHAAPAADTEDTDPLGVDVLLER